MAKLTLDLHDIFNNHNKIEQSLEEIVDEALETKVKTVEIIPGKGSGQLKRRVIRFFEHKAIKSKYHRLEKDSKNFGRIFIHFKHK